MSAGAADPIEHDADAMDIRLEHDACRPVATVRGSYPEPIHTHAEPAWPVTHVAALPSPSRQHSINGYVTHRPGNHALRPPPTATASRPKAS